MGLPESFVDRVDRERLMQECARLAGEKPQALAALTEDSQADYPTRLAAGSLLGLLGDPRVRAEDPAMVDVLERPSAWRTLPRNRPVSWSKMPSASQWAK
jgi:hypothetical protein